MKSKSVIITGTSRGIGLETALAFGRAGYNVFATMRNPQQAPELGQRAKKESLPIFISVMDVNSDESVKQGIETILKENGSVDVLVNNAGIARHGSIEEVKIAAFKEVMETNYFGALRCIQQVLPGMRHNKSGCIINVTSIAGRLSNTPLGPYCASKWALEAVSEALAQEVRPFNIRVANVEPGIIDTEMAHEIHQNGVNSIYPQVKRFGGLFAASLRTPTSATLVANKILEIAENGTWQLRHPVGPDAEPFLQWRASIDDQSWIDWHAVDDDTWYNTVERDFGLNARKENSLK
jgi:NAD(P)-dependent dehydrogenase (short-subunit alcohol dehydrogenase family)